MVIDHEFLGKLKGLFGAGGSASDDIKTESAENVPPRDGDSTSTDSASASPSPSAAAEKKEKKEPVENTIALTIETRWTTIPPMTVEQKKKSRSKFVDHFVFLK